jgi:plastocyanin
MASAPSNRLSPAAHARLVHSSPPGGVGYSAQASGGVLPSTSSSTWSRRPGRQSATWLAPLVVVLGLCAANCGEDDPAPAPSGETAGSAGSSGADAVGGAAGHAHGEAGAGGGAGDGGAAGEAGAGGESGASAGGASEDPLVAMQGCEGKFEDRSDPGAERTIEAFGVAWKPPCIEIAAGQTITWAVDFTTHPLHRGTRADENAGSADNPIPNSDSGSNAAVTFPTPGLYPFYCVYHATPDGKGMVGLVRVK